MTWTGSSITVWMSSSPYWLPSRPPSPSAGGASAASCAAAAGSEGRRRTEGSNHNKLNNLRSELKNFSPHVKNKHQITSPASARIIISLMKSFISSTKFSVICWQQETLLTPAFTNQHSLNKKNVISWQQFFNRQIHTYHSKKWADCFENSFYFLVQKKKRHIHLLQSRYRKI